MQVNEKAPIREEKKLSQDGTEEFLKYLDKPNKYCDNRREDLINNSIADVLRLLETNGLTGAEAEQVAGKLLAEIQDNLKRQFENLQFKVIKNYAQSGTKEADIEW